MIQPSNNYTNVGEPNIPKPGLHDNTTRGAPSTDWTAVEIGGFIALCAVVTYPTYLFLNRLRQRGGENDRGKHESRKGNESLPLQQLPSQTDTEIQIDRESNERGAESHPLQSTSQLRPASQLSKTIVEVGESREPFLAR